MKAMEVCELTVGLVRLFKPIRSVFASLTLVFFFKETLSESINADWPILLLIGMRYKGMQDLFPFISPYPSCGT